MLKKHRKINKKFFVIGVVCIATTLLISYTIVHKTQSNVIVIYSNRKEELLKEALQKFTAKTNIKASVVYDSTANIINKIEQENKNPTAEVFISFNEVGLALAKNKGFFQKINLAALDPINNARAKSEDVYWLPLSKNAWVIAYNKTIINPLHIQNYEDLSDAKLSNKIILSEHSCNQGHSLLAALIAHSGTEYAKVWLQGLLSNAVKKQHLNDMEQIKNLSNGDGAIIVTSSSILAKFLQQNKSLQDKIGIIFPNQNNHGTHIDISGIGILKNSKNKHNAITLIKFLLSEEGQLLYAAKNNEYPLRTDIAMQFPFTEWQNFKQDDLASDSLVYYAKDALKITQNAGWR